MTSIQLSGIKGAALPVAGKAKKFGRYSITGLLGEGSMGFVYRAHDPRIDRPVALKVLRSNHISSEKYVQRFTKEAKAIGRLSHPNIVTVHDVGEDHGTIYIAMELIEGHPLDQLLKSRKFNITEILDIGIQVAAALDYAHQKGVVHRDIKPSNLIMLDGGHIKLTDFGIAHLEDTSATQHTRAGDILGTPAFMSPEQIEGETIDRRTDLFSLGIILYKLTTGEWPFSGKSMAALFNAISNCPAKKPKKINATIPQTLSVLIMKSLEKNPVNRFQTGKEMVFALQSCRTSMSTFSKKRTQLFQACGLVLAACLFATGWWLVSKHLSARPMLSPMEHQHAKPYPIADNTADAHHPSVGTKRHTSDAQAASAAVSISSDPSAARIYIDGQLKGTTPTELKLPLGVYELRLNLSAYHETKVLIDVSTPGAMPLNFRLASKATAR